MTQHHIFGIRHHGPGSARAVQQALWELDPDIVLVEGPPDGNDLIRWLIHPDMDLPVALLVYRPDQPQRAGYYPFTSFSPELQAMRYALEREIPVRFADLPQSHLLAIEAKPQMPAADPLIKMAEAAGFRSYEEWWNQNFEQRLDSREVFEAILLLMQTLRQDGADSAGPDHNQSEPQLWAQRREAMMRRTIRQVFEEGYRRVAFVCGAWHAPAVSDLSSAESDDKLLENLPEVVVEATWVPWTYGRLSYSTGYGAGILSPGWYHHLWTMSQEGSDPRKVAIGWLSQVATLLRDQGLDASSAHVIQAVRLAEALSAMRDLPFAGLTELNDAALTVLCSGDVEPMKLIERKLIVGERLGMVPPGTPMVPLQRDLLYQQKRLQFIPEAEPTVLALDLRKDIHLARSQLLHRLIHLNIPWGQTKRMRSQPGSSHESWQLQWQPDFAVRIIEASIWGNTVEEAASQAAQDAARQATDLSTLTKLLDGVILAGLAEAIGAIIIRIQDETALSSDIPHMMAALPPLARVMRYGNVRKTDQQIVSQVVDSLLTRICIGLPSTCASLDDDAAAELFKRITSVDSVIHTLRDPEHARRWYAAMRVLVDQKNLHGLLAGRACRLLLDESIFQIEDAIMRLDKALHRSSSSHVSTEEAMQSAAWLDGFLQGSELLILHDRQLWQMLDKWVRTLGEERFLEILPLLRRTFSKFSQASRRQLQDRVKYGSTPTLEEPLGPVEFDSEQAKSVLPLIGQLLGIEEETA